MPWFSPNDKADIQDLKDAGYETSDVGRGNGAMTAAEIARETGSSSKEAARAGHDARDDMQAAGDMGIPSNVRGR
jgi:hypothetical protein